MKSLIVALFVLGSVQAQAAMTEKDEAIAKDAVKYIVDNTHQVTSASEGVKVLRGRKIDVLLGMYSKMSPAEKQAAKNMNINLKNAIVRAYALNNANTKAAREELSKLAQSILELEGKY